MVEVNRYIIIENTNHPIYTRITVTKNQYGYIIGLKNDLKKIFPAKLLDRLFKNHLYQNIESAYNDYNNYWSLQRLVCCLYTKISDKVVHHINKLKMVNNIDIRKFGSQGQQRTAALSLKLSEIELVKRRTGDTPVLLLDDVLSELDGRRQNYLLNSIENIQTLITCTGLDEFINHRFAVNRIYKVIGGTVTVEN